MRTSLVVAVAGAIAVTACTKAPPVYRSNVAQVRIANRAVASADTNSPYTGALIARDQEILAVARDVLAPALFERIQDVDPTGLILVLNVRDGAPEGTARLLVDLKAPRLNPEVARRSGVALELGKLATPTIRIAEATFKAGKLDGSVTLYEPTSRGGVVKAAEAQVVNDVVHGTAREYVSGTTRVRRELSFADSVLHGPYKQFHDNGKLALEQSFERGKLHGVVAEYYADGAKRARRDFAHGVPVGEALRWYPSGIVEARIEFDAQGMELRRDEYYSTGGSRLEPANGVIEEFYPSGALRARTTYVAGVRQGAFTQQYASGKPWKAGTYQQDRLHGRYQTWWKNGKPALDASYEHGVLVGAYRRWYDNGKDWETATYVAGKLDGPYRKYWKNGKPAHVYAYKRGKLDGEYRQFYASGARWAEATYVDGKAQGVVQRWFPDGKLGYVMNHEGGRPHGPYKRWWADGSPRLEANHVSGQLDGDFKNWLENGTPYEMATYRRGARVAATVTPPVQGR